MVLRGMVGMMLEMMLKMTAIEGDVAMVTPVDIDLILNGYSVHYWSKRSPGHHHRCRGVLNSGVW